MGTTTFSRRSQSRPSVHPHMCGDNGLTCRSISRAHGSPPHVWGQRLELEIVDEALRFTPTCVGTTAPSHMKSAPVSVHPHMCGDNKMLAMVLIASSGSPPHVWGQQPLSNDSFVLFRFTPTCVGTTVSVWPTRLSVPVHPHMCGDNETGNPVRPGCPVHPHVCGDNL